MIDKWYEGATSGVSRASETQVKQHGYLILVFKNLYKVKQHAWQLLLVARYKSLVLWLN